MKFTCYSKYGLFGLFSTEIDLFNGDNLNKYFRDTKRDFNCFGFRPYKGTSWKCNAEDFEANLTRSASKSGETFTLTYTPQKKEITVEGDSLKKTVVIHNVPAGTYTPVVYLHYKDT